jgi:AAA+ superfamily predicted ATPase
MTIISQNLKVLYAELDWLSAVIDQALTTYLLHEGHERDWQGIPLPTLNPNTAYGKFVDQHQLDIYSRLAIALAIVPNLRPQYLDVFYSKNVLYDRGFTEFGGQTRKEHVGFLPTAQTLNFLLTSKDQSLYERLLDLFLPTHVLQQEQVIGLEEIAPNLPKWSGLLSINQNWLTYFVTGEFEISTMNQQLGTQMTTDLTWDDLVIDQQTSVALQEIMIWSINQHTLMQDWGLARKLKPGYRALFYGAAGTGKKLSATLIGKSLGLSVYRIDLAALVSKYIGETEKNLNQVFEIASKRNLILFFDEVDMLFAKTTAAETSNDHTIVDYFSQKLADFEGLVIVATHLKAHLSAHLKALFQHTIYFSPPDAAARLQLWKNAFSGKPKLAPDIDLIPIAEKYELTSGAINNVLRYCALAVLQKNESIVQEKDLMKGIEREIQNL